MFKKMTAYVLPILTVVVALVIYNALSTTVEVDANGKPIPGGKRTKNRLFVKK